MNWRYDNPVKMPGFGPRWEAVMKRKRRMNAGKRSDWQRLMDNYCPPPRFEAPTPTTAWTSWGYQHEGE